MINVTSNEFQLKFLTYIIGYLTNQQGGPKVTTKKDKCHI